MPSEIERRIVMAFRNCYSRGRRPRALYLVEADLLALYAVDGVRHSIDRVPVRRAESRSVLYGQGGVAHHLPVISDRARLARAAQKRAT